MMISAAAHRNRRPKSCGRLAAAGLSVIAMLTPFSPATGTAEAEPDCPSVQMIFARGTFEQPGVGATGQAFIDAVSDRLGGKSMDVYAANYPASLDFTHAAEGIIDVRNKVQSIATTCPSTKIVLGGYSGCRSGRLHPRGPVDYELLTGITGPMPAAMADHIAAVALSGPQEPVSWHSSSATHHPSSSAIRTLAKTIQFFAKQAIQFVLPAAEIAQRTAPTRTTGWR